MPTDRPLILCARVRSDKPVSPRLLAYMTDCAGCRVAVWVTVDSHAQAAERGGSNPPLAVCLRCAFDAAWGRNDHALDLTDPQKQQIRDYYNAQSLVLKNA